MQATHLKKEVSRLEDYLEAIYHLIHERGYASTVDLSEKLGVKPSTVSVMVGKLDKEGYLEHEPYRGMRLTPKGEKVAISVISRHSTIFEFLSLIGVDEETAYQDAEGIEHHVQPKTVRSIGALVDYLRANPTALEAVKSPPKDKTR
jgi:Mn-dependent DtxR family transcriptional regulator